MFSAYLLSVVLRILIKSVVQECTHCDFDATQIILEERSKIVGNTSKVIHGMNQAHNSLFLK